MSYPIDEEQILITKLQHKVVYWNLIAISSMLIVIIDAFGTFIAVASGNTDNILLLICGLWAMYVASLIARSTAVDYRKDIDDITGANEL